MLGQPLALVLAVLLSRGSGGALLAWAGLAEAAALGAYALSRLVSRARGNFSGGVWIGWAVGVAPCVIGVVFLAWAFALSAAIGH